MSKLKPVVFFFAPFLGLGALIWSTLPGEPEVRQPTVRPAPRVEAEPEEEDLGVELPPVEYQQGRPTMQSLSWRVAALVQSNPDQEFAREMDSAIVNGELTITWGTDPGAAATFTVLEPALDPSVRVLSTPSGEEADALMPAVMVSLELIMNINTREDVVFMQLVLQHEYEHYKQWLRADAQRKLMSLKLNKRLTPDAMEALTGIPRNEVCAHMLESEVHAYTVECTSVLARQTPPHLLPEICEGVGTPRYAPFIEANLRAAIPEIWRTCP